MSLQPSSRRRAVRITLALLCLLALAYALFFVETVDKYSESYSPDASRYIELARRLLTDHVYSFWGKGPDAYVTPGFPLFLAGCMKLFGTGVEGLQQVKRIQALLHTGTVFLTYLLGKRLTGRDSVGLLAAGLIAFNATYPAYSRLLLTETLYFFLMMLFFVVFHYTVHQEKLWLHLLSGVLLGAAVMTRPLLLVVAPLLYLSHIRAHRGDRRAILVPIGLFAAGFLLVALPWWIRNAVTLHRFIPLATQSNPIFAGLAEDVSAMGLQDPGTVWGNVKLFFSLLCQRPLQTLYWMTAGKFGILFQTPPATELLKTVTTFCKDFSVYVGLLGCVWSLHRKEHVLPIAIFLVYLLGSFLAVPTSRYALQYLPFLAISAGNTTVSLFSLPRAGRAE